MKLFSILSGIVALLTAYSVMASHHEGSGSESKAPSGKVYFKNLKDGQKVGQKFKVKFGLKGMKIKEAGQLIKGTGHHHLIINGSHIKKGQVVPADETHIHFGKGQTETDVELKPGKHTLTLQFADGAHLSYGKKLSNTITVNVQ